MKAATAALASSLVFFKKSFALAVHRWVPEVFKRLGVDYYLVEKALAKVVPRVSEVALEAHPHPANILVSLKS